MVVVSRDAIILWHLLFDLCLYFTPIYSVVLHTILTEQDARSLHARLFTPVTAVGVGQVACCSRGKRMICIARWRRICALYRKRALSASNEDEDQSVTVFVGRSYPPEKTGTAVLCGHPVCVRPSKPCCTESIL